MNLQHYFSTSLTSPLYLSHQPPQLGFFKSCPSLGPGPHYLLQKSKLPSYPATLTPTQNSTHETSASVLSKHHIVHLQPETTAAPDPCCSSAVRIDSLRHRSNAGKSRLASRFFLQGLQGLRIIGEIQIQDEELFVLKQKARNPNILTFHSSLPKLSAVHLCLIFSSLKHP
jgi:hypothetical protein